MYRSTTITAPCCMRRQPTHRRDSTAGACRCCWPTAADSLSSPCWCRCWAMPISPERTAAATRESNMHRTARGPSPGALITAACLGAAEEDADGEEREDRAARLDGRKRRSGVQAAEIKYNGLGRGPAWRAKAVRGQKKWEQWLCGRGRRGGREEAEARSEGLWAAMATAMACASQAMP